MHHPAIKFLLLFLGTYLGLQGIYTTYLWVYAPEIDPITFGTAKTLSILLQDITCAALPGDARVQVLSGGRAVFNLNDGCNGIAVWIALVSFLVAFQKARKYYFYFIPLSIVVLFGSNLLRLIALVEIRLHDPAHFNIFHDIAFPAILYGFAFLIIVAWVRFAKDE